MSPLAVVIHLTVLVHVHKAGSSRTHHRHVTAVLPVLFIQPLYIRSYYSAVYVLVYLMWHVFIIYETICVQLCKSSAEGTVRGLEVPLSYWKYSELTSIIIDNNEYV